VDGKLGAGLLQADDPCAGANLPETFFHLLARVIPAELEAGLDEPEVNAHHGLMEPLLGRAVGEIDETGFGDEAVGDILKILEPRESDKR
jgi:hypothetical protein